MKDKVSNSRINKSVAFILIVITVLILLRIVFHYLEISVLEIILFYFIPKWFLFILPTCFLFYRYTRKLSLKRSALDYYITTIGFLVIYYLLTPYYFQKFDWNINYTKRNKIVALAKNNKLNKLSDDVYSFPDSLTLFPFIRPNQVFIQHLQDTIITISFYADGGSLEHFPRFVYSNDKIELQRLDNNIESAGGTLKLETNWYLIHN